MTNYILYILFTAILVLIFPILDRILKGKANRIFLFIYFPIAISYVGITILISVSSIKKDTKLQSLEELEYIIRDFSVNAHYTLSLSEEEIPIDEMKRVSNVAFFAYFVDTSKNGLDTLKLYTDYKFDMKIPNSKAIEIILELLPCEKEQILGKKIDLFEKYDILILPYDSIERTLKDSMGIELEQNYELDLKLMFLVNGKYIGKYEISSKVTENTIRCLVSRRKGKFFWDVKDRYSK